MFASAICFLGSRNIYTDLGGPEGLHTLLDISIVSTLFYGIYFVLFVVALYLYAVRHAHDAGANAVFVGTVALFVIITIHWALTIASIYSALAQTVVPPALQFYVDPIPPIDIARNLFLLAAWVVGNLLIIHRLSTVWQNNSLVVAFPVITWLGLTASGIAENIIRSLHFIDPAKIFPIVHGWFTAELTFTLYTQGVLVNIVESAAIYSAWIIFDVSAYLTRSRINYWVFESSATVVGIVNMLIYMDSDLATGWIAIDA
ncbi:hypothetical protein B0H11DRAFT_2182455 [Mycena galericulata]|nr:hypothetical protein B0H11DRAFT_2182455 [Mycena galericulata]